MNRPTFRRIASGLPRGRPLALPAWRSRHRGIVMVLWLHLALLPLVGAANQIEAGHLRLDLLLIAPLAILATQSRVGGRRLRAVAAVMGLLGSSAMLVHFSQGMTEMHFHFFVVIAIVTLYEDWVVFASAIVFVLLHHGVIGTLRPHDVFATPGAWSSPWRWAAIHAAFVLAASVVHIASWRAVENQHERAGETLRRQEARFRSLIEHSSDGITVVKADGSISYDSPSVRRIMGYRREERDNLNAFDFIIEEDRHRAAVLFSGLLDAGPGATAAAELGITHGDGSTRWMEVRASNATNHPDLEGIVLNFRDSTHRRQLEAELSHQAFHDPLTGLANRTLFLDRIEHARATQRRSEQLIAVVFIDVDDFKSVNDAHGHSAGDLVLTTVATRLLGCLREVDTCARLGGDEFGILLEGLDGPAEAYELGARVIVALSEEMAIHGHRVEVGASVGIVLSAGGDDPAALLQYADLAMYEAKAGGKGRYEIFERGMYDAAVERIGLRADLRAALNQEQFVVHYQPIVDLEGGDILGAEALVRWNHPERGLLAPASFLTMAEDTGMIVDIGRVVLMQACHDAARWVTERRPMTVSVNLSVRELREPDLVDTVRRALERSGLDPARLIIEITESVLVDDPAAASVRLLELKALGVAIALDDFGTGYSSLSYLSRFPVDVLKIDKCFVDALAGAGTVADASLVATIAGLGEMLHLTVTGEGIERAGQVSELLAMGCKTGQGFYFAPPMANDLFVDMLRDGVRADSHSTGASPAIERRPLSLLTGLPRR